MRIKRLLRMSRPPIRAPGQQRSCRPARSIALVREDRYYNNKRKFISPRRHAVLTIIIIIIYIRAWYFYPTFIAPSIMYTLLRSNRSCLNLCTYIVFTKWLLQVEGIHRKCRSRVYVSTTTIKTTGFLELDENYWYNTEMSACPLN